MRAVPSFFAVQHSFPSLREPMSFQVLYFLTLCTIWRVFPHFIHCPIKSYTSTSSRFSFSPYVSFRHDLQYPSPCILSFLVIFTPAPCKFNNILMNLIFLFIISGTIRYFKTYYALKTTFWGIVSCTMLYIRW